MAVIRLRYVRACVIHIKDSIGVVVGVWAAIGVHPAIVVLWVVGALILVVWDVVGVVVPLRAAILVLELILKQVNQ